ncbi:MAG: FHA domain-containing protein [Dehalococcoidia bacterium]|nr:FHA domain-containing protein [Dehalococcoidia bacterium]
MLTVAVLLGIGLLAGLLVFRHGGPPAQSEVEEIEADPDETETLTEVASAGSDSAPLAAQLIFDTPEGRSQVLLHGEESILGRDPLATVVLTDPLASRQHARITRHEGEYWIEDLRSMNGTLVNGTALSRQRLEPDDLIQIGQARITFALESPAASGAPAAPPPVHD